MSETADGRFGAAFMTSSMRTLAAVLGVNADDAFLIRLTNNAVFALPRSGIVIRISRSEKFGDRAAKVARLGAWFADVDAPTIRLAAEIEQPLIVNGLSATVWELVPDEEPPPTEDDLAHCLIELRDLGPPPFPIPRWNPVDDARRRINDQEGLGAVERDALLAWCDRLQPQIDELREAEPTALIHGDAHLGNLLRTAYNRRSQRRSHAPAKRHAALLCDFDPTCVGPWKVDLVAVAVGQIRFGRSGAHRRLANAYGYDIMNDPRWPLFREARELKMVAAAVPLLRGAPGVAAEFQLRLRSALSGDESVRWTPFAQFSPAPASPGS